MFIDQIERDESLLPSSLDLDSSAEGVERCADGSLALLRRLPRAESVYEKRKVGSLFLIGSFSREREKRRTVKTTTTAREASLTSAGTISWLCWKFHRSRDWLEKMFSNRFDLSVESIDDGNDVRLGEITTSCDDKEDLFFWRGRSIFSWKRFRGTY